MGVKPDPAYVASLADEMSQTEARWRAMLTRMRFATDFQSLEYFQVTNAWLSRQGQDRETVGLMLKWRADALRALSRGQPPPPPPPGLNLTKASAQSAPQKKIGQDLMARESINVGPFTGQEHVFDSEVVRSEYEQLVNDHEGIITLGEQFGTFDPVGKLAYLDALEAIEGRWDVFYSRFELLDAINPVFKQQTTALLESMGMSTEVFREVLEASHALIRKDAEAQRENG